MAGLLAIQAAEASHFRYGSYFWTQAGGNSVSITLQNAFRRTGYGSRCVDPATPGIDIVPCTGADTYPAIGDVVYEGIGDTTFNWGDGTPAIGSPRGPLLYRVTSVDPTDNWLFGLALDPAKLPAAVTTLTHQYAAAGDYTAFTESCCRIGTLGGHINNPGGSYRVETIINAGGTNNSPISVMPPIVQCPKNKTCSFKVPGADPDGDRLRFRLSTSAEAAGSAGTFVQPGPPKAPNAAAIDPDSGTYTWDTTGAALALGAKPTLYSTQVTIEDLDGAGKMKSKIAVDFFIQLVDQVVEPPVFVQPPTPTCNSTVNGNLGSAMTFTVQASSPAAGDVTLNVAGLPPGATLTPALPTAGNPVSTVFSWTPTQGQQGVSVVTFSATNAGGGAVCSFTLKISKQPAGGVPISTATPTSAPAPKVTATRVPTTPTSTPTAVSTVLAAQVQPKPAGGAGAGVRPAAIRAPNTGSGPDNSGGAALTFALLAAAALAAGATLTVAGMRKK
ncbi:MAG: hypothetical protein ACYDEB_11140 [Dehalococcoidia bacterium]